jgi:hypothetical protein
MGPLVAALSLRQRGREAEGRERLARWSAREPASALAAWAGRAYDGEVGPLPEGADEEARVIAAWLRAGGSEPGRNRKEGT